MLRDRTGPMNDPGPPPIMPTRSRLITPLERAQSG